MAFDTAKEVEYYIDAAELADFKRRYGASEEDAHTLVISFDASGERKRAWSSVASKIQESAAANLPVSGPRTAAWVVRFLSRRNTGPEDHHRWWRSVTRLSPSDWGVSEHLECCRTLETAGSYDQLDLANVAVIERVCRRLQVIEYQCRERARQGEDGAPGGRWGG